MSNKNTYERFYSWSEFTAQAALTKSGGTARKTNNDDWAGGAFKEALEMATGPGYQSAVADAERLSSHVSSTVAADLFQVTFQSRWEVAGAEVDMGRFLAGEPECMIESEPIRIARQGRAVRVICSVGYSASVSTERILRRGAAVLALIDILSRAQHPLEVWAVVPVTSGHKSGARCLTSVQVQAANEPMDMGRVMYALAHPTMLRRLVFGVEESYPDDVRDTFDFKAHGSYGYPTPAVTEDAPDVEGTTIVLPSLDSEDSWDEAFSVKWIEEQLATIFG